MDRFNTQYDKESYKKLTGINEEIAEERGKENPDAKRLQELYMRQLMAGMGLNQGPRNRYTNL